MSSVCTGCVGATRAKHLNRLTVRAKAPAPLCCHVIDGHAQRGDLMAQLLQPLILAVL